jgi:hypothetical protein
MAGNIARGDCDEDEVLDLPRRERVVMLMNDRYVSATDVFFAGLSEPISVTLLGTSSVGGSAFTQGIPFGGRRFACAWPLSSCRELEEWNAGRRPAMLLDMGHRQRPGRASLLAAPRAPPVSVHRGMVPEASRGKCRGDRQAFHPVFGFRLSVAFLPVRASCFRSNHRSRYGCSDLIRPSPSNLYTVRTGTSMTLPVAEMPSQGPVCVEPGGAAPRGQPLQHRAGGPPQPAAL